MKSTIVYGMEGLEEATYGGGFTPSPANDGILLAEPTTVQQAYQQERTRLMSPHGSGRIRHGGPTGRIATFTTRHELRGIGVAYSATDYPRDLHVGLVSGGHAGSVVTTPGSEAWTYACAALESARGTSGKAGSGAMRFFARDQEFDMIGALCNTKFSISDGQFAMFEFDWQSMLGALPTQESPAVPAALVYDSLTPPLAHNLGLTIAPAFTPVLRSVEFDKQQEISPRDDKNAAIGTAGFKLGRHDPQLVIVMEQEALATHNPYSDWEAGTLRQIQFSVGATQYNKMDFDAAQAQVVNVEEDEDETSALWRVTYSLVASDEVSNDEYTLVFN